MIVLTIYLDNYDWLIKVYYAVDTYYTDEILGELDAIDCPTEPYYRAELMLENFEENTGFTYSDLQKHVTLIIIGLTTSPRLFMNTLVHEVGHAAIHISEVYDIDPYSEELPYLLGDIVTKMFPKAKKFLCACQRGR